MVFTRKGGDFHGRTVSFREGMDVIFGRKILIEIPCVETNIFGLVVSLSTFTGECMKSICAMVKSRYIGDGHPTFNDGILIMGI